MRKPVVTLVFCQDERSGWAGLGILIELKMKAVSIIVRGKVQGVYFRQSTCDVARALGIRGYVRNEADGSVYIVAAGDGPKIDQLIDWCWTGPPGAKVNDVEIDEASDDGFTDFTIRRI